MRRTVKSKRHWHSKMNDELLTQSYDYDLPSDLIASHPVHPRDHAKLLVYDRSSDTVTHTKVKNMLEFLPQDCTVFLNDTRVIKARVFGKKESGGRVELLLNKPLGSNLYQVMIKGRVKEQTVINFDDALSAKVISLHHDGSRTVEFFKNGKKILFEDLVQILDDIGHMPLPPYIHRENSIDDENDYQTLFAKEAGAVAAPTASLHFTPELLETLKLRHSTYTLTLHIGAGTFKPVESENILEHPMHSEYFHIPPQSTKILDLNKPILAVGTTVTRTIEHYARTKQKQGECDLFLNPSNPPIRVNHLLTNFHLPKSTLIMLVSSFIGREKTLQLYEEAIQNRYRFFSYGDAMLIL